MIYNTQQSLWDNYYASNPGAHIRVHDGHIIIAGEVLARMWDSDQAVDRLVIAGYPASQIEVTA